MKVVATQAEPPGIEVLERSDLPKLPGNWKWIRFESVCEKVSVGHVGKTAEYFEDGEDSVIFLRSQNVRPGRLVIETATAIAPEFHQKLKKSQLKPGDILFVRVGANRGDCCEVPDGVGELNCANIVFARPKIRTGLHAYFFQTTLGRSLLMSASVGAAQGVINTGSVASMPVPWPPIQTQHRITGVLSAYDDLIENNLRRIKILEDMAQSLYREWFVHFRFPGHESTKMIDSPLGPIPEGWEVKKLGEFGLVVTGKTPSKKKEQYYGGDVPFLKTPDMHSQMFIQHTTEVLSDEGAATQSKKTLPVNSICVSCIGTVGVVSITTEPCQTNQQINSVVLNNMDCREFLYLQIKSLKKTLENLGSTGATMTNVNKGKFEGMNVLSPAEKTLQGYSRLVAPMFDSICSLQKKNHNLRKTRDLLLPKLLTPTNV